MNQTFPIKCTACQEILDVAADIDVAAAYNCPMCGVGISVIEAEAFELECPDEVVIEEQTAECLRLHFPKCPRFYFLDYSLVSLQIGLNIIAFWLALSFLFEGYFRSHLVIELFMCLSLLTYIMFSTLYAIYFLKGTVSVKLSDNKLHFRYHLGMFSFGRRFNTLRIRFVFMKNQFFAFDPRVKSCIKLTSRSINIASDQTRDTARFITHLLRRQLKTMGHDLNNGRS